MTLLTERQYEILGRLVRTNETLRNISREAEVSEGTVVNFRRACVSVDSMSEDLRDEVRRLVSLSYSTLYIASALDLPSESVRCLRRLDRFRKSPTCSECGAVTLPPRQGSDDATVKREKIRGDISQGDIRTLCDIVLDLLQLSDLRLISHPLFRHLSQRAEKAYEEIHGKREKVSDGHSQGGYEQ